jgi:hypothetical protein
VRNLVADVDEVIAGARSIGVKGVVLIDGPHVDILMWHLNILMWHLNKVDAKLLSDAPTESIRPLIILGGPETALPPGEWARQQYSISVSSPLRMSSLAQWWRWLVYRETPAPAKYETVIMYVAL